MKIHIKQTIGLLICCFAVLFNASGIAQVYKSTDDQGNVTFSDTPAASADKIQLPEPNTIKAIEVPPKEEVATEDTAAGNNYVVTISSPANDSVIANGLVGFTVTTETRPKLDEEHQLQLNIDGKVHSLSRGSFKVRSINRGPHSLQVNLINKKGATLAQSPLVNVFAYRPSTGGSKK